MEEGQTTKTLADKTQDVVAANLLEEKQKQIEELENKLKKDAFKTPKKKRSKSKGSRKSSADSKENIHDFSFRKSFETRDKLYDTKDKMRETVVKTGMGTDEVMKLLKTVIESTKSGVPLETQTLGASGAKTQNVSEEFINDLVKYQKDKINFVGAKGGSSVMQATSLTRRDKITLMKLGLSKGLLDDDLKGKDFY